MIRKDNLEEFLGKYFDGRASGSELKMIDKWLDESKENQSVFAACKKAYIEIELNTRTNAGAVENAYSGFLTRINKFTGVSAITRRGSDTSLSNVFVRFALVAVIVILAAVCTYLVLTRTRSVADDTFCEIVVPYGGRSSLVLPDGSKIWLNAGSRFKYLRTFDVKSREVYLDGEAFFTVEKSRHPFVVHTSHLDIVALGTAFNVKSYSEDENIETTLVEGKIQIERKESDRPLYLNPRQKLTYHKTTDQFREKSPASVSQPQEIIVAARQEEIVVSQNIAIEADVNTDLSTSWKDGKLIINNEPLEELIKKLERKYDIVFQFDSEALKTYSYSGTLRDFPLEQILKALELTSPITYSIAEKTVTLSYNKHFKPVNKE